MQTFSTHDFDFSLINSKAIAPIIPVIPIIDIGMSTLICSWKEKKKNNENLIQEKISSILVSMSFGYHYIREWIKMKKSFPLKAR